MRAKEKEFTKLIEDLEDAIENLLDTVEEGDRLDKAFINGFGITIGGNDITIKLSPSNLRDIIDVYEIGDFKE